LAVQKPFCRSPALIQCRVQSRTLQGTITSHKGSPRTTISPDMTPLAVALAPHEETRSATIARANNDGAAIALLLCLLLPWWYSSLVNPALFIYKYMYVW